MRKVPIVIGGVVLTAAFLLNPVVGLDLLGLRDEGGPSAREMAADVVGTWDMQVEGDPVARTVVITPARSRPRPATARASWVAPAAACSDHTIIASAAACLDSWTMPLNVEVIGGAAPVAGVGTYTVEGGGYGATLRLTIGRDELRGTLADGRATLSDDTGTQRATLVRRPR